jgi:hypothetical protein
MARFVRSRDIRVVHINDIWAALGVTGGARLMGASVVLNIRDTIFRGTAKWRVLCRLSSEIVVLPRLKAVARMATRTAANAATANGCPRLKCRARPSRREKKMMFIAPAPSPWGKADLYDPVLCTSKTCTSLASSSSYR